MSPAIKALPGTTRDPLYPDCDGRFMGDSDFHSTAIRLLYESLQDFLDRQQDYVASNLVFYFEQGNPSGRRDPDVLVAKGVGNHFRRSFRVWEEKALPCVLFEIASEGTWRTDLAEKRALYARLGIKEYFVYDPEGVFISPVLQGFRLENGGSAPVPPAADGSLTSQELGVKLMPEGTMLRLIDLTSGDPLPTRAEQAERAKRHARQQQQRAERERQHAQELAAEVERLRALLERRDQHGA